MLPFGRFSFILVCVLSGQTKAGILSTSEITEDVVDASSPPHLSSSLKQPKMEELEIESEIQSQKKKEEEDKDNKEKVPAERLECFADYLVMMVKGAKTEIFAEKEKEKVGEDENENEKWIWRIKRAVVRQAELEALTIYECEMAKEIGAENAKQCFTWNKAPPHGDKPVTKAKKGKKSAEVLVKIRKIFDRRTISLSENIAATQQPSAIADRSGNLVNILDLFDRSVNGRLQVSDEVNKKLEKQSDCLASFLVKNFGLENQRVEIFSEEMEKTAEKAERAILVANKKKWHWDNDELVRWKWAAREEEEDQKEMPEIRFPKKSEKGKNPHFIALNKCISILPIKDVIHKDGAGKPFLELKQLLARFRDDQMFVGKIPKKNKEFTIIHPAMQKVNECAICLGDFVVGDKVLQMSPCKHIFHKKCILPWLKNNDTCPMCRGIVDPQNQQQLQFAEMHSHQPLRL